MKNIELHLYCKDYKFMNSISDRVFSSGFWSFTLKEASMFVGCNIYFHNKLTEVSYRGGQIIGFESKKYSGKERIIFMITEKKGNIGKTWYGDISKRIWCSINYI